MRLSRRPECDNKARHYDRIVVRGNHLSLFGALEHTGVYDSCIAFAGIHQHSQVFSVDICFSHIHEEYKHLAVQHDFAPFDEDIELDWSLGHNVLPSLEGVIPYQPPRADCRGICGGRQSISI